MDKRRIQKGNQNTLRWMKIKNNIPKLWNAPKAVFKRKFIAVNDYVKKGEKISSQ